MSHVSQQSVDTIIVSDVHLGSQVSRPKKLTRFLDSYRLGKHHWGFDRLILLGDIFDSMNFGRMSEQAWKLVHLLREIADPRSDAEVVWVIGNHDIMLGELLGAVAGLKAHEEYMWRVAGKRFFAMHGHQFDKWIIDYPNLSKIPGVIYDMIQAVDGPKQNVSRYVKAKSKVWLRINDIVAEGIMAHVKEKGLDVDAVFCGHTHIAEALEFEQEGTWYYNTGCWTGHQPPNYVAISHDGSVALHDYVEDIEAVPVYQSAAS